MLSSTTAHLTESYWLEGRRFTVYTDHRLLVGALHRISEPWSTRQQRQLSFISEYTADIQHTPGAANIVADTLSRPAATAANISAAPPPAMPLPVNLADLAAAQADCPDCRRGRSSPALNVMQVQLPLPSGDGGAASILVDTLSGVLRPLVPAAIRRPIFDAIHSLAHPGTRATRRLISSCYVWPRLTSDIAAWCKACEQCCHAKVTRQPAADPVAITVPTTRFSHIHVDLVGPLPAAADGSSFILTAVDRTTRWAEAYPLQRTTADDCLAAGWFCRYGIPAAVTTDRGVQFTAAAWSQALSQLGIGHIRTTAYHPQSNGLVERFHRRLKDALKARLNGPDWPRHLLWVLLGLRAAPREDSGLSTAELVFGAQLNLLAATRRLSPLWRKWPPSCHAWLPCSCHRRHRHLLPT
jgi:Integrase zinc binding domain/Integrase core domain